MHAHIVDEKKGNILSFEMIPHTHTYADTPKMVIECIGVRLFYDRKFFFVSRLFKTNQQKEKGTREEQRINWTNFYITYYYIIFMFYACAYPMQWGKRKNEQEEEKINRFNT